MATPAQLNDVTIASGANVSRVVEAVEFFDAIQLAILAPSALDGGAITFETSDTPAFTTARTIQVNDPPTDLAPPAAGKARHYMNLLAYPRFRFKLAGGNAAADRVFKVYKLFKFD